MVYSEDEPESKTRLRLWIRLLRLTRETESELRERLRVRHKTTLPRFDVLAALYQYQSGIKMSELSDVLLVSNGSATVVVDRLVKENLVQRSPVPGDRRALSVKLTKAGKTQFLEQACEHENWVNSLLSGISATQANDIMKILDASKKDTDLN
jgi:DNA-binding MarR family transcriptional regulator